MITVTELLQPVETDLETLLGDLRSLIGAGHPILQAAAEHLFSAGGKRIRPGIVLLISRALSTSGGLSAQKGERHERETCNWTKADAHKASPDSGRRREDRLLLTHASPLCKCRPS